MQQSVLLRRGVYTSNSTCFQVVKASHGIRRTRLNSSASAVATREATASTAGTGSEVRVRFAPSPTGNLHVGGARTALFNWLYAKRHGGKFIVRIEDTDQARSTRESEEAMIRDLKWLGLTWDEGPDVGGPHGPYRQSERTAIYKENVDKLVAAGKAYPCFCTDAEIDQMKKEAEEQKIPPIYRGKWASATAEEVTAEMAKGTPYCYRFRVPKNQDVTIQDVIRGQVTWNTDNLGDFVLLRSNGLPVYNFCVAIDDALMKVTHVIRAEEHLSNTLRQVLIYNALGFPTPVFGHVSLILAPDKSKLSKRHGATSVGEFQTQGYLAPAMLNYLSLLGWNDGTEQEIYTVQELYEKFSLERITKSPAVFDKSKLNWMNGQHLSGLSSETQAELVGQCLVDSGLVKTADSEFVKASIPLLTKSLEVVNDVDAQLVELLAYPLNETLASEECKSVLEDDFKQVVEAAIASYESGELVTAAKSGLDVFKKLVNSIGKAQGRKGKRLFMPLRVALTGRMHGPEIGDILGLVLKEDDDMVDRSKIVSMEDRIAQLKAWAAAN